LRVTKLLDAPIELVWKAWTDAGQIANWWGPDGFTNTIRKMEVKNGGEWLLTMHGPDGKNYPNKSRFIEIVPLKKIEFQHFNPNYLATVVFQPKQKETFLDWTMVFETVELFEIVVKTFRADEGLRQNVEKLDRYLHQSQTQ
jgi:uncharacterized protein YndB with AHSA1/START domain